MEDEREWFCERVRSCENSMYVLALGLLRSDADAKDAMQEALLRAYRNLDSLKNRNKFKSWIMRIVTNTSYDMLRQRREYAGLEDGTGIAVEEPAPGLLRRTVLWDAVQKLSVPYRTVVVLFYYEDFPVREISRITGDTPATVRKQLSRAREQLKQLLPREVWED